MDSFNLSAFLPKKLSGSSSSKPLARGTPEAPNRHLELPKSFGPKSRSGSVRHQPTASCDGESRQKESPERHTKLLAKEHKDYSAPLPRSEANLDGDEEKVDEMYIEKEFLPVTECANLAKHHERAVSALAVDPKGVRMVSGGYDYTINFWDFSGMDRNLQAFREIQPWEGYQIKQLQFSHTGDSFLVASGAVVPKLYDREGHLLMEYNNGDRYIRDMRHTQGHIAPLTTCQWNPIDHNYFLTAGADSTIRIWDAEYKYSQRHVIISKNSAGHRLSSSVTASCFTADGKRVIGARSDGALSIWDWKQTYMKPQLNIDEAHQPGSETSGIVCASDNVTIASRGGDGTLKLWDARMFTKPIKVQSGLQNFFPETNVILSPDEQYIITGESVKRGEGKGHIRIFDRLSLRPVQSVPVCEASVVRVLWHPSLNQIITGNSDSSISVFYDSQRSSKGILTCLSRKSKKRQMDAFSNAQGIFLPNALLEEGDPDAHKRQRGLERADPVKSRKPDTGHRESEPRKLVGASETEYLMSWIRKDQSRDEDPREVLLKFAQEAETNPMWINHVYKETQPKPIFDETKDELEEQRKVLRRQ